MKNSFFLVFILFFIGCASNQELEFTKPDMQVPRKSPDVKKGKGSLYSVQGTSLFADKKDLQVGDIIQVVISENLSSKTNNKRELASTRKDSLGGGLFTPTGTNTLGGTPASITNRLNKNIGIDFGTNSTTADKGSVNSQTNETFSTTISTTIEETYQNGNYYIKGKKEMLIEGQKQDITITGVIRPYDISSDNSINSSQVANLKLLYDKKGDDADVLDTPWGLKFIRGLWPF